MLTADAIFGKVYGGAVNFITPHIISRNKLDSHSAYELSKGKDFIGGDIWGVTVCGYNPEDDEKIQYISLSKCFSSKKDAIAYIEYLKENFKDLKEKTEENGIVLKS